MCEFNIKKYSENLETVFIGRKLIYFKEIDSTNNYASELINKGSQEKFDLVQAHLSDSSLTDKASCYILPHNIHSPDRSGSAIFDRDTGLDGTVILADIQSEGRGQFERKWISPSGGLWFTMILKPEIESKGLPSLTLLAAYSVVCTFKDHYNLKTLIKWPNDIYFFTKKIGGILSETEIILTPEKAVYLIIGFGLNVNFSPDDFKDIKGQATTIRSILNKNIEIEVLLCRILLEFENNYSFLKNTGDFKAIFDKIQKYLKF